MSHSHCVQKEIEKCDFCGRVVVGGSKHPTYNCDYELRTVHQTLQEMGVAVSPEGLTRMCREADCPLRSPGDRVSFLVGYVTYKLVRDVEWFQVMPEFLREFSWRMGRDTAMGDPFRQFRVRVAPYGY